MSSLPVSTEGTPSLPRPSRPYRPIPLYWDLHAGINENGQGVFATRKQLQEVLASLGGGSLSAEGILSNLVPGAVVQLADGLYWLSQDWQVLCL